ncbi:MAG: tyrosine-type recombinase/integrase [Rhodocyclaceae bacterium]|nr:tyrosine-type recombinase/integrase [Rhodocyclaceae bacterium]
MLTDTQCRTAKPKGKPYKLTDGKGLYLEVSPGGSKLWRYRFELKQDGRRKESTASIGEYASPPAGETPEEAEIRRAGRRYTLGEARDERQKARALVKQGINPATHRKAEKAKQALRQAVTFDAVADEWLGLQDWSDVTRSRRRATLARLVFPSFGSLPVRDVEAPAILAMLKRIAEKNGVTVMEETRRTLHGIFELAAETFRVDSNPVHRWKTALPTSKTKQKRPLNTDEIGQLMRDVTGYAGRHETAAAFRLMWWSLARPSEVVEAEWSEFDLDAGLWRIPAERMKKRREHAMLLPRQAVEMLRGLHAINGHRKHLFPGRDDRSRPMTMVSLRQMLSTLNWSGKYSPHATRVTGSTRLNELGYAPDWIERQLAHVEQNRVRATYNHAEHVEDRAKMMQAWADLLDAWEKGADVVPLNAGKRANG